MLGSTYSACTRKTEKRANIVKKVLKIPNKQNTHTRPTNSMEKSFSNRSDFTIVSVGKGLVA